MTAIRLALIDDRDRASMLTVRKTRSPSVLVSYWYAGRCGDMAGYDVREWVLDSGAFSAHNSGVAITNDEYISFAKTVLASDCPPAEVFALDVIGDAPASLANAREMVKAGVACIPTFHIGEPVEFLEQLVDEFPKIALGGMVGQPGTLRRQFVEQVFARVWPKPMHAFGVTQRDILCDFPFHSADASNWQSGPRRFGRWEHLGTQKGLSVRKRDAFLGSEIEYYMDFEARLAARWMSELKQLEEMLR